MTKEGPTQQPCPRRDRRIMFRRTRSREDRPRYRGRCQIHVRWCEESARNCRWMEGPLTQHDVATANAGESPLPSVDPNENGMRNLLAQELESNRRRDAPLQLAHGSAIDLACAAARVTLQTSKSGDGGWKTRLRRCSDAGCNLERSCNCHPSARARARPPARRRRRRRGRGARQTEIERTHRPTDRRRR